MGAGLMGYWHHYYTTRLGVPVVAVVDPILEKATALAARSPGSQAFQSLDDALDSVSPSSLHLCTSLEQRKRLMSGALDSRANLLIEKPVASSLAEWEGWLERSDALLMPCHQFVWQRGFQKALRGRSRLGRIVALKHCINTAGGEGLSKEETDGLCLAILPHSISLFQAWLGSRVLETTWSGLSQSPDYLEISGLSSQVRLKAEICLSSRPTRNELWVLGTAGSYRLDLFHGFAVFSEGTVSRWHKATLPVREAVSTGLVTLAELVRRGVRREPAYPGLSALLSRFYKPKAGDKERFAAETKEICAVMEHLEGISQGSQKGSL